MPPSVSTVSTGVGRHAAYDAVSAIRSFDEQEVIDREAALEWIASGVQIFRTAKPDVPPKHLVAYFALVDRDARSVLLVDHRNAGLWLPTGGHVEPDEDAAVTVNREAREELGIDAVLQAGLSSNPLFVTQTTTVGTDHGHVDVSLWYVLEGQVAQPLEPDSGEFAATRWWPFADIAAEPRVDPQLPRFITKLTNELN
jgi:8-oxo-dGTP pyrophosphatase MutT (NUDIX family)